MHEPHVEDSVIRKLWLHEIDAYRDHLLRLDPQSRNSRFGGAVSDDFIREHVVLSNSLDAVIHGFFVDGVLRGAAEMRPLGSAFAHDAEVAFSVEQPWQSHGVGSALLERTLLAARNRSYQHLHMVCLAHNTRMQQLARKFAAELTYDFGSVVGDLEAAHPTPLSLIEELMEDSRGFATAMLDVQARLFRPA